MRSPFESPPGSSRWPRGIQWCNRHASYSAARPTQRSLPAAGLQSAWRFVTRDVRRTLGLTHRRSGWRDRESVELKMSRRAILRYRRLRPHRCRASRARRSSVSSGRPYARAEPIAPSRGGHRRRNPLSLSPETESSASSLCGSPHPTRPQGVAVLGARHPVPVGSRALINRRIRASFRRLQCRVDDRTVAKGELVGRLGHLREVSLGLPIERLVAGRGS
jgi:hypothetical protein